MTPLLVAMATVLVLAGGPAPAPAATTKHHFITNRDGSSAPQRLGFNVFDTGSSTAEIRRIPAGVDALVWLGEKCPTPLDAAFRRTVDRLAGRRDVFGYYLSDEPHLADCPGGPQALASRARYIREASSDRQLSFIVLSDREDYRAFRPAVTGVSMVGLDPYPCSVAHPRCDLAKIDQAVGAARRRGIPAHKIVPVYQAFGQSRTDSRYYQLPSPRQLQRMLRRWATLVPDPPMDYTYGWGHQGSANPTLVDSPRLQEVLARFFAG
ncbi:hypothetical protein [Nocardioides sp. Soil774]|uniref:hypothetical protein n=1 Tax=Nocardioides sp. Soil774 TaxID=1736408 RepID=UPI0012FBDD4C|nr:hypothetical protein [Nocardioides sp. Soil774]